MGEYDDGVVRAQKTDEHKKVTTVLLGTCRRDVGERAERWPKPVAEPRGRTLREGARWQARHGEFGIGKLQSREGSIYSLTPIMEHGATHEGIRC